MSADKSKPWLKVVGIGENGLEGLSPAARQRVESAEILFGGKRHLEMIAGQKSVNYPDGTGFLAVPKSEIIMISLTYLNSPDGTAF